MVYLLINSFGLSNLIFLIVIGVINWMLLYGFIQFVSRATSVTTHRTQASAIRARRRIRPLTPLSEIAEHIG